MRTIKHSQFSLAKTPVILIVGWEYQWHTIEGREVLKNRLYCHVNYFSLTPLEVQLSASQIMWYWHKNLYIVISLENEKYLCIYIAQSWYFRHYCNSNWTTQWGAKSTGDTLVSCLLARKIVLEMSTDTFNLTETIFSGIDSVKCYINITHCISLFYHKPRCQHFPEQINITSQKCGFNMPITIL